MNEETLWLQVPAAVPDHELRRIVEVHQSNIALKNTVLPQTDKVCIILFVADHGVAIEKPPHSSRPITTEILNKFIKGDATINVLARKLKTKLEVINLGTVNNLESTNGVTNLILGAGTSNLCHKPAMTREQLARAVNAGRQAAQRIKLNGAKLFIGGEINTGQTTAAITMSCALLGIPVEELIDINIDHNNKYIMNKPNLIQQALSLHKEYLLSPLEILRRLGSFEIAALTGSYLCCAHIGLPVFINSFVSAVAALTTVRLCPDAKQWFLFSHTLEKLEYKIIREALYNEGVLTKKSLLQFSNSIK